MQSTRNLQLSIRAASLALVMSISVLDRAVAVDFHVATAQELQNALTLAAANGADDIIYLTNGYYIGNFNFNSAEARSLTHNFCGSANNKARSVKEAISYQLDFRLLRIQNRKSKT